MKTVVILYFALTFTFTFCPCYTQSEPDRAEAGEPRKIPFSQNLNDAVSKHPYLVLFYTPAGCSECRRLFPILEQLEADKVVKVEKINCQKEPDFCEKEQGTFSNPTLKLYIEVQERAFGIRYPGNLPGNINTIGAFINRHVGSERKRVEPPEDDKNPGLTILDEETFGPIIQHSAFVMVKYCTGWSSKCKALREDVWKELARHFQFDEDMIVAHVDCERSKGICRDQGIRSYPTLQWWKTGILSKTFAPTDIPNEPKSLISFATEEMGGEEVNTIDKFFEEEKQPTSIIFLNKDNYQSYVGRKDKLTFIQFWTAWCSDCERMEIDWENLAIEFNDNRDDSKVTVANIDCVKELELCQQENVVEFPTLRLYKEGKVIDEYKGNTEEQSMINYLLKQAKTMK